MRRPQAQQPADSPAPMTMASALNRALADAGFEYTTALTALAVALTIPNVFLGVHFNRYLMWAFPGLLAFTAAGLGVATRLVARDDDLDITQRFLQEC